MMLNGILNDLIAAVRGASAAVFLDGDGEMIAQAGSADQETVLRGAWKEIHLDRVREITAGLRLGAVHAVLFSVEDQVELAIPVDPDYSLVLFLSPYADLQHAIDRCAAAIALLLKDIA